MLICLQYAQSIDDGQSQEYERGVSRVNKKEEVGDVYTRKK